jgi:hypothetical protein
MVISGWYMPLDAYYGSSEDGEDFKDKRLIQLPNLQRMQTDPPAGVSASPVADNVMTWYFYPPPSPPCLPSTPFLTPE